MNFFTKNPNLRFFFQRGEASMNLKFHMQHDQTPRLQDSKIASSQEFKMAAVTENSKFEILYEV